MGKKLNPDSKPAEKLLSLYTFLLMSNREISRTALAEKLEVAPRTVSRLIEQLEASRFGKVLIIKKGKEHCYKLDKPKEIPCVSLDAEGLNQLIMCRDFLLHLLPRSIRENIDSTIQQVTAYTCNSEEDTNVSLDGHSKSLTKGSIDYSNFQQELEAIVTAIRKGCVCTIQYKKSIFEDIEERKIIPTRLLTYSNSISVNAYLIHEKSKARLEQEVLLPLHRIKKVLVEEKNFIPISRAKANNEDVFGFMINNSEEIFKVEVEFYGTAANYVTERHWSKDQEIKIIPASSAEQNKIILTMSVKNKQEFFAWVLGYGDKAKIISPVNIVEEMKTVLENIQKNYK